MHIYYTMMRIGQLCVDFGVVIFLSRKTSFRFKCGTSYKITIYPSLPFANKICNSFVRDEENKSRYSTAIPIHKRIFHIHDAHNFGKRNIVTHTHTHTDLLCSRRIKCDAVSELGFIYRPRQIALLAFIYLLHFSPWGNYGSFDDFSLTKNWKSAVRIYWSTHFFFLYNREISARVKHVPARSRVALVQTWPSIKRRTTVRHHARSPLLEVTRNRPTPSKRMVMRRTDLAIPRCLRVWQRCW